MLPAKKAAMLKAFNAFSKRVADQYKLVGRLLEEGNYVEANNVLAKLTTSHARTAMSLRAMLIREGFLPEEDK